MSNDHPQDEMIINLPAAVRFNENSLCEFAPVGCLSLAPRETVTHRQVGAAKQGEPHHLVAALCCWQRNAP